MDVAFSDDSLNLGPTTSLPGMATCVSVETSSPDRRPIFPGIRFVDYRDERRLLLALRCLQACEALLLEDALDLNVRESHGSGR